MIDRETIEYESESEPFICDREGCANYARTRIGDSVYCRKHSEPEQEQETYNETIRENMRREQRSGLNSHGFGKHWEPGWLLVKRGHFAVNDHEEFPPGTEIRVREYERDPGYVEIMLPNGAILTESPNLVSSYLPISDREQRKEFNEPEPEGFERDPEGSALEPIEYESSIETECCGNPIRIPDRSGIISEPCPSCKSVFERKPEPDPVLYRRVRWNTEFGSGLGSVFYFGSIDGEEWVELNRIPTQSDRETIAGILAGTTNPETGLRTFPITCTNRYFETGGNAWESSEPITAPSIDPDIYGTGTDSPEPKYSPEPEMNPVQPLPIRFGLPNLGRVEQENDHGNDWKLIDSGDQGSGCNPIDRYFARFESSEGFWADYFYIEHRWSLGAN